MLCSQITLSLLSYSVVESPVLSLLIGRDVVEGLGLDIIKGSSKTLEYNGRSQPLETSVAGHYCVTLSPERYAGLLKLENSPDPLFSRLRPRPTSLVPKNSRSKLASTLEICLHSFGGAQVFCMPCVHFDDSEVNVKRSRLAPAQVMSTALTKSCDWSLGFDVRVPVFDEIKDWRHSIFLTGRAA